MKKYKHMLKEEEVIWERFLIEHGGNYRSFEYDLHVGRLFPELEKEEGPWRKGAAAVYLKRIDAVGYQRDSITIFEVKPHAGLSALGQVLGYLSLYDEDFSPGEDLKAAVVTALIDPSTRRLLENHGIEVFEFRG